MRLRNPTEDKRAFRRMLTSADPSLKYVSEAPGNSGYAIKPKKQ